MLAVYYILLQLYQIIMGEKQLKRKNIDIPMGLNPILMVAAAKVGMRPKNYLEDIVTKHLLRVAESERNHEEGIKGENPVPPLDDIGRGSY